MAPGQIRLHMINGKPGDVIPVTDRGLQYGDGLFETIAVQKGDLLCWDRHLHRLQRGCRALGIPPQNWSLIEAEARGLCADARLNVCKLILTRGTGGRGYAPPADDQMTRIMSLYPWPYPGRQADTGIEAGVCDGRLGHNPELAEIKHLNRLEQVQLRRELTATDFDEALVLDISGKVISGTMSNVFLVKQNVLITPDLSQCGIRGVIRDSILELAPEAGLQTDIKPVYSDHIQQADELFFCNSLIGIWPVTRLQGQEFTIGRHTRALRKLLQAHGCIVG